MIQRARGCALQQLPIDSNRRSKLQVVLSEQFHLARQIDDELHQLPSLMPANRYVIAFHGLTFRARTLRNISAARRCFLS